MIKFQLNYRTEDICQPSEVIFEHLLIFIYWRVKYLQIVKVGFCYLIPAGLIIKAEIEKWLIVILFIVQMH